MRNSASQWIQYIRKWKRVLNPVVYQFSRGSPRAKCQKMAQHLKVAGAQIGSATMRNRKVQHGPFCLIHRAYSSECILHQLSFPNVQSYNCNSMKCHPCAGAMHGHEYSAKCFGLIDRTSYQTLTGQLASLKWWRRKFDTPGPNRRHIGWEEWNELGGPNFLR